MFGIDDAAAATIIGAAITAGGGLGSAAYQANAAGAANHTQYKYAKRLANFNDNLNREYAMWSARNLPSYNRQGMEMAGFNPILAYSSGTGTSGGYGAGSFSAHVPDLSSSNVGASVGNMVTDYVNLRNSIQSVKNQTDQTQSIVALNSARALQALNNAELIRYKTDNPDTLKTPWGNLNINLENYVKGVGNSLSAIKHDYDIQNQDILNMNDYDFFKSSARRFWDAANPINLKTHKDK